MLKAITGVDNGDQPPPPPPESEKLVVANCTWLNFRTEPQYEPDRLNVVASNRAGMEVIDLGQSVGAWRKVRVEYDAWAHEAYLVPKEE